MEGVLAGGTPITSLDVYNRGTWGKMYDGSWIRAYTRFSTLSYETSAIKVNGSVSGSTTKNLSISIYLGNKTNQLINFMPYNSINFIVSRTGYYARQSDGDSIIADLEFSARNTSGVSVNTLKYSGEYKENEHLVSLNLSNLNISGYIDLNLYYEAYYSYITVNHDSYIHRIFFT